MTGSYWAKWDLHVHTPASLTQDYGKDEEAWERFISDLENLPEDFKAIGINDYIFIDGYERILKEKNENNRLQNIELFLPVVELRLDKFGGTDGNLSRLNFHVIFSEEISPEVIRQQFLSALYGSYHLDPASAVKDFRAGVSMESLEELGRRIIDSVPEHLRKDYGDPLIEGFNNINFPYESVVSLLNNRGNLEGNYLTAIGKTEWSDIKWTKQSIAEKKDVINSCDIVFTASESVESYFKSRRKLRENNLNDLLVDCSDAHSFSSSQDKDRIGNNNTWIKGRPCFEALKQAVFEPQSRICVSYARPQEPLYCINGISINIPENAELESDDSGPDRFCFSGEYNINFSPYFTCVVGGRGSGKSTLVNLLKVASGRGSSFFHKNRVKDSGKQVDLVNSVSVTGSANQAEFVNQNEIELFAGSTRELTKAILDRTVKYDHQGIVEEMMGRCDEISNNLFSASEVFWEAFKIDVEISDLKKEINSLENINTVLTGDRYQELKEKLDRLEEKRESFRSSERRASKLKDIVREAHNKVGQLTTSEPSNSIDSYINRVHRVFGAIYEHIGSGKDQSVSDTIKEYDDEINNTRNEFVSYLSEYGVSEENIQDLQESGSELASARSRLAELQQQKEDLVWKGYRAKRNTDVINDALVRLGDISDELSNLMYTDNPNVSPVSIKFDFDLENARWRFAAFIASQVSDHLNVRKPSEKNIYDIFNACGWPDEVTKSQFISCLNSHGGTAKATVDAIRKLYDISFYDAVARCRFFSYFFDLKENLVARVFYGGKELSALSFGQRCTAVLVVLLCLGNGPLIIDEPEAHLDSKLIAEYMVDVIKERKGGRQIIFATHNANFVINGDAELVLALSPDESGNTFVRSVVIEDMLERDRLLSLEGGVEAFQRRTQRYSNIG